jgi:acyl-CoA thioesterase FadM
MDMKPTTHVEVGAADVDERGYITPARLIQVIILAAMDRNRTEGGGKGPMRENFSAAWMFRRIRLEQLLPIREGDELEGFASGRTVLETEYVRRGELYVNGALAARCDLVMMPVQLKERAKLAPTEIERLYDCPPSNEVEAFPRLPMLQEFPYKNARTITEADCDDNAAHFASHNYAGLICAETGYWDGPYRKMKLLQIDYVKECVTGDRIKLGMLPQGGGFVVQGIHENGKPCFNAYCEYA